VTGGRLRRPVMADSGQRVRIGEGVRSCARLSGLQRRRT
jgi:hypothetical protein